MKIIKASLIFGIMLTLLGSLCAYAATYTKFSSKFIKHFKDCEEYQETIYSEFEGSTFTTNRKILGWKNGYCRYEEVIKTQDDMYKLTCNLVTIQVDELYDAMKDKSKEPETYGLETFHEQTDEKTGKIKYVSNGITTIKGNKAYVAWAKYQNNPYFCKPEKLR